MKALLLFVCSSLTACYSTMSPEAPLAIEIQQPKGASTTVFEEGTWSYFLQHLPTVAGDIVDYTGTPIRNQAKHVAILNYDVGKRDLQQCADALIRLRAEYLFAQKRYNEIAFRFTSGEWYRYKDYVAGVRPAIIARQIYAGEVKPVAVSHATLRSYLDIIYAFAGTQSLYRDLLPATDFRVGTIIITPGSPGHCCMVIDETTNAAGQKRFKLVESYMPAQSIYVLKNPEDGSAWYPLQKGTITTASYQFTKYALKKFE
ncbi:MAG: hypothetical protein JWP88_2226 [Flaviaesturariibacter sp.]|nr:hypothetical protein [Flaviaesturariibacter sp.]